MADIANDYYANCVQLSKRMPYLRWMHYIIYYINYMQVHLEVHYSDQLYN
jgi:hypothetical protein